MNSPINYLSLYDVSSTKQLLWLAPRNVPTAPHGPSRATSARGPTWRTTRARRAATTATWTPGRPAGTPGGRKSVSDAPTTFEVSFSFLPLLIDSTKYVSDTIHSNQLHQISCFVIYQRNFMSFS